MTNGRSADSLCRTTTARGANLGHDKYINILRDDETLRKDNYSRIIEGRRLVVSRILSSQYTSELWWIRI
ncbi:hypothetical protein QTP88_015017 [Uroleucon formosanum]